MRRLAQQDIKVLQRIARQDSNRTRRIRAQELPKVWGTFCKAGRQLGKIWMLCQNASKRPAIERTIDLSKPVRHARPRRRRVRKPREGDNLPCEDFILPHGSLSVAQSRSAVILTVPLWRRDRRAARRRH